MTDRIWLKQYPPGVPAAIHLGGVRSVRQLVHEAMEQFAERVAFTSLGAALTFSDVDRLSRDFAAFLQSELGLAKGDRVAMMAPNSLPFAVGMFGVIRMGGVQVNVNPLYTARELRHQLQDAEAETIVIFSGSTPTLAEIVQETPIKNVIVFELDDLVGKGLPSPPCDGRLRSRVSFAEALARGAELGLNEPELGPEDLLFLQYTGGTTGLSKGAMLTHGNLVANMRQFEAAENGLLRDGEEAIVTAIPMYHIFALMVNTLGFFKRGARNALVVDPRDVASFVETWAAARPTVFTGVNTLFNGLLHTPRFRELDFSELKLALGGGAPVQQAVNEKWKEVTGSYIKEGYGLSETSPVLTLNLLSDPAYRPGIGIPLPGTDISLRDDDGHEVAQGLPGEVCAKGPQVMAGYWRRPDATAESMTADGYFKTGDIGVMDADGFFQIVDRKKDMILVSGFNVFPNEIEEEAARIPGVLESACIGVPDESTGEAVKLFVVKTNEQLSADEIRRMLRERLVAYKVPRTVEFIEQLPKSAVGKILRRELR